jgi:outer membrane receptor for monomeric catechols
MPIAMCESYRTSTREVKRGSALKIQRNSTQALRQLNDFARATIVGGTNSEARRTADVDYAFADSAAVRVNAMGFNTRP